MEVFSVSLLHPVITISSRSQYKLCNIIEKTKKNLTQSNL